MYLMPMDAQITIQLEDISSTKALVVELQAATQVLEDEKCQLTADLEDTRKERDEVLNKLQETTTALGKENN